MIRETGRHMWAKIDRIKSRNAEGVRNNNSFLDDSTGILKGSGGALFAAFRQKSLKKSIPKLLPATVHSCQIDRLPRLGNTILVKLELWESVMVIIVFGLPQTYAYATLRQSVAGKSTFRGIVFCNLGTPKTVISNFVTSRQIETPYISPYGYPNDVPVGQKMVEQTKKASFLY